VGLLAALPNIFPLVVLFGVMGYAAIPLNVGTTMAAAIAIGLAVDDTMHFMLRYNQELRSSKSQLRAMRMTIRGEALPVIATSVALMAGFLVFALSDFAPVAQFGILSALVIGTALLADFVITPLVISALRLVTLWDLLSGTARQQVIPKSALFRGMRPWQIRRFVLSSALLEFGPGEYIFRRDEPSNDLYLVMRGAIEVSVPKEDGSGRVLIDRFGSGEIFGDVALLANEPRHADAVTLVPTCVLVFNRESIHNTILFHPFIGARLFLNLAVDISRRWVRFVEKTRQSGKETEEESAAGGEGEALPDKATP
jgi:CRP-like cAMP-binding protein